ncbi:hypothetical protein BH10PSE14_BH10PSE14_06110 [soil metagenome]
MITDRQLAYEFAGLSLRNLHALIWLCEHGKPARWFDITDHCPGWRPSFRTTLEPLISRGLIRPVDSAQRGISNYEPTHAGAAIALRALRGITGNGV